MMARSRIFDSKGRLEMGLKLSRLSESRPGFFRRGVMDASFSGDGTDPDMKEVLMILMIRGMRIC